MKRQALTAVMWLLVVATGLPSVSADDAIAKGEKIYRSLCLSCHGEMGAGTAERKEPLLGDKSVLELARYIDRTMPEGEPQKCVGDDARHVAAYIHETFYSPTAQARNQPARIELSRLTVRQYQQTIADLLATFRPVKTTVNDERGLKGEYFAARNFNNKDRAIERVDPTVQFDFGEKAPAEEKFDPQQFSARWQGSLIAPETGEYEFIVRTEHAARLFLNDQRQPLIDAWVKSGNDTEYRASIKLLGGRLYPLRLEYSKAKQGVDDSKKGKPKPVTKSSITLLWQRPHLPIEVIPQRQLTPQGSTEVFVVQTPFPPDDRSRGFERGTAISKAWDQATTDAAIEVAAYVTSRLDAITNTSDKTPDRQKKLQDFCERFAERAFRRPLLTEQRQLYIDRQFEDAADPAIGVKQSLLLILKSPRFLFRDLNGIPGDDLDVAARLSYALWDSLPDQELLKAVTLGQMKSEENLRRFAEHMLGDLRARTKLREFFLRWLKVDQVPDLVKDAKQFPGFSPELSADLRTSLELFVEEVVASPASDFRQLLLADSVPLNGRLAKFYGVDLPADAPFQNIKLDAPHRVGVLTHPYLLASFAYNSSSSPIHRGVLISRGMLGRILRQPPEAITPVPPELQPDLTTRQRVTAQTKAELCNSCHGMINPLGFALENFDAVGRFRAQEKDKPIDATGSYLSQTGQEIKFAGPRELATFVANSDETHTAFAAQLFHHLIKQPVRAYGSDQLPRLKEKLKQNDFSVRKLVVEIVVNAARPTATSSTLGKTARVENEKGK